MRIFTLKKVLATINKIGLTSLNCHRHTESSDFLGGLRPDRGSGGGEAKSGLNFSWSDGPLVTAMRRGQVRAFFSSFTNTREKNKFQY